MYAIVILKTEERAPLRMLVSNASPLIHLTRLAKLPAVAERYGPLLIPTVVHEETVEAGRREGYADASLLLELERRNVVRVQRVPTRWVDVVARLKDVVGAGEAEAIALARAHRSPLLMDDAAGRRAATYEQVVTLTTLALLLRLGVEKVMPQQEIASNMRKYAGDAWIAPEILARFLQEVGSS